MKTDDYIKEYVEREKLTEHNRYLTTRIMAKVNAPKRKISGILQTLAVAASITGVVMMGIVIGNTYAPVSEQYAGININDSEIENFVLYNTESNE